MAYDSQRALQLLRLGSNVPTATFHEGKKKPSDML